MRVLMVIEGKIPKPKMYTFESQYVAIRDQPKPKGMITSMLLRDDSKEGTYRIETLWENREALEATQKNISTTPGLALFKSHGIDPDVRVFDVTMTIKGFAT